MRRVVVTGLGMVTPLGCGVDTTWTRILSGQSGARKIDTFEVADLASRIACVIPRGDGSDGTFNPDQWMEPKEQRKVDDFIIFAMAAARQALDDADWHPSTEEDKCATGTLIGSGIGGLSGIADTALLLKERGPRRVSPFFIPGRNSHWLTASIAFWSKPFDSDRRTRTFVVLPSGLTWIKSCTVPWTRACRSSSSYEGSVFRIRTGAVTSPPTR